MSHVVTLLFRFISHLLNNISCKALKNYKVKNKNVIYIGIKYKLNS